MSANLLSIVVKWDLSLFPKIRMSVGLGSAPKIQQAHKKFKQNQTKMADKANVLKVFDDENDTTIP